MERLSDLFTTRGALADTNGDGYADDIALRFVLPDDDLTAEEWCALADLAATIGLRVTGFSPPLVVAAWDGPTLTMTHDAALEPGVGRAALAGNVLTVSGADGAATSAMLRALASGPLPDAADWTVTTAQYPCPPVTPETTLPVVVILTAFDHFERNEEPNYSPALLKDTNGDGLPDNTRSAVGVMIGVSHEIGVALVDFGARVGIETTGLTLPLFVVDDSSMDGKDDYTLRVLADNTPEVEPFVPTAEPQPEETVLWRHEWRGRTERDALLDAVRGGLPDADDGPCSLLAQISEPGEIRAAVRDELRAMLPDGSDVTVLPVHHAGRAWLVEVVAPAANVLPGLASLAVLCKPFAAPEGTTHLDLPIRWLQECWLADELIAPFLVLPLDAVTITLGGEDQEHLYIACACDEAGETVGEWTSSPRTYMRPYLPGFPDAGNVVVCTGGVALSRHGRTLVDADIATDLDGFWDEWQGVVLPALRAHIREANGGEPTAAAQPFFDELRVEVWVSEPEYALGIREERESPAEGLAEDIYFNALDYVAALGKEIAGVAWEEPGQIVPLVHVAPGEPPRAVVSLVRYEASDAELPPAVVVPRTEGVRPDEVVTGANLPGLLAYLDTFDAVTVRGVGQSFRGRPIAAVEVVKPDAATVRSRTKLAAIKPTHLIVARHHANEVASTTAALQLIEQLATDPKVSPLLDRVNVVFIPDENPDGTALHARLMAEHPAWKHHAARYNAVGVEFARHFGDDATPYGEARVRPLLWRQWRPDVVTDNHGVPTHEWWQPFAGGGSPPRFPISYWLCQALVYGICRHPPDDAHATFAAALRDAVSAAIVAAPDLAAANREYAALYERWGHRHAPARFPAVYHGDLLWFFGPVVQAKPDAPPRDIALREPRMVSASWITEVLDETATGPHLALVAKAHRTANLAALRLTADHAPPVTFSVIPLGGGRYRHRLHRARPLIIEGN